MKAAINAALLLMATLLSFTLYAANVKITPLGSHSGDFCRYDRALLLEDPVVRLPVQTIPGSAI